MDSLRESSEWVQDLHMRKVWQEVTSSRKIMHDHWDMCLVPQRLPVKSMFCLNTRRHLAV